MKVIRIVLVMLLTVLLLVGCTHGETKEADGTSVYEGKGGVTKVLNSIPYKKINYNNEEFSLMSVDIYQAESASEYGYFPYVVMRYDISSMSEKGIHWMFKERLGSFDATFDPSIRITNEKNGISKDYMSRLYCWYDNDEIIDIYHLPNKECKNDFSDTELSIEIDIMQDDTYMDNGVERQKINKYLLYVNNDMDRSIKVPILHESEMPEDVKAGISKGYDRILNDYSRITP